jgi:hypothetical protein
VLEGAEWVCQNTQPDKRKEAIIIFAAKERGDQDSLDAYLAHLSKDKSFTAPDGKTYQSQKRWAKTENVNGQVWVDAMHLDSEIKGFYTSYFATIREDIGVLVTFSVNRLKYQDYLPQIEEVKRSLRVFRKPGGLNSTQGDLFKQSAIPSTLSQDSVFPNPGQQPSGQAVPNQTVVQNQPNKKKNDVLTYGLIGAGAILLFALIKRKKG